MYQVSHANMQQQEKLRKLWLQKISPTKQMKAYNYQQYLRKRVTKPIQVMTPYATKLLRFEI